MLFVQLFGDPTEQWMSKIDAYYGNKAMIQLSWTRNRGTKGYLKFILSIRFYIKTLAHKSIDGENFMITTIFTMRVAIIVMQINTGNSKWPDYQVQKTRCNEK